MTKNLLSILGLIFLLVMTSAAKSTSENGEFNKPVPESVRQTVKLGEKLVDEENFPQALNEFKKAITAAPHFLLAHIQLIKLRALYMEQENQVKSEYETLMEKNPDNPVYPAALFLGLTTEIDQKAKIKWREQIIKLAPESVWGYYAKAMTIQNKQPEAAIYELFTAIEKDPSLDYPYIQAISIQSQKLKKIDDAITTAEKMAAQPDLKLSGLSYLWKLRLEKAERTEEAKTRLRQELTQLAASSQDIKLLAAVHFAYDILLRDINETLAIEKKILRINPKWSPKSKESFSVKWEGDKPAKTIHVGREAYIYNKLGVSADNQLTPEEQIAEVEHLLSFTTKPDTKVQIYFRLFRLGQENNNDAVTIKYGEMFLTIFPENVIVLSDLALLLADQKDGLKKALVYARQANELTKDFLAKDTNNGNKRAAGTNTQEKQMDRDKALRAHVLDSYGSVLFKMGKYAEAEPKLREALELGRSENRLSRLSEALRSLNRLEEANKFALEAKTEFTAEIRRKFKSTSAKDFELSTIDGRKVKLSDLKGKVVMVNFWATWCSPCIKEMAMFAKVYEKYKERGLEILAISVDAPVARPAVLSFVSQKKISFPILDDASRSIAKLYGVDTYPTTFFISKQGNLRYQNKGFNIKDAERELEFVIEELMKDESQ